MNFKKILLVILLIIGIFTTSFFYKNDFSFSWPLVFFLGISLILYFRNFNMMNYSTAKLVVSVLLSVFWLYSSYNGSISGYPTILKYIVVITTILCISFCFYLLITELESPYYTKKEKNKWVWFIIFSAIPFLNWMRFYLAYFPGKMTFDSFWQWSMAHGIKPYNAWHPILHTWWIQISSIIYNSPASYILSQMIVVSLIIGYSLYVMKKFGAPIWLVLAIAFAYAFYPINEFYIITMWKDVPFSAFILLVTVLFGQISISEGEWLKKKSNILFFILVVFIAMNLRNNGFLALTLALIASIFILRKVRKRLLIISTIIIMIHFVFNGPVMNYFHVIKNPLNQALAIPSQQIAATYKKNGDFTPELKTYFDKILPAKQWKKDYNPYTVDPIKHDAKYNTSIIEKNFKKYLINWAKLMCMNFKIFVIAYLDQVSVIWQFHSPDDYHVYFDTSADLEDYPLGLRMMAPGNAYNEPLDQMIKDSYNAYTYSQEANKSYQAFDKPTFSEYKQSVLQTIKPLNTDSKLVKAKEKFDRLFIKITNDWQNYLLKGAIPLLLILLGLAASIRRFKQRGFVVFGPALFVLLTIAVAMPATDFRYSYSFIFSTPFLLFFSKFDTKGINVLKNEIK